MAANWDAPETSDSRLVIALTLTEAESQLVALRRQDQAGMSGEERNSLRMKIYLLLRRIDELSRAGRKCHQ